MKARVDCRKDVECSELQAFMPCVLGKGHLRPCEPDNEVRRARGTLLLRLYRRALEQIVEDERGHECLSNDADRVTRPCVLIATEALSKDARKASV